jgi:hypothetical protein
MTAKHGVDANDLVDAIVIFLQAFTYFLEVHMTLETKTPNANPKERSVL